MFSIGNKKPLQDKKILLLESSKEFKWESTEKYSNRVVALTPATQKLLESIGAWDIIERTRYGSVKKMQVNYIVKSNKEIIIKNIFCRFGMHYPML